MTPAEEKELKDTVAALKAAAGLDHLMSPRMTEQQVAENRPDHLFPSGDYNLAYRVRQIGISQDNLVERRFPEIVALVGELDKENAELRARISALESAIATGSPPAGVDSGLPIGGSQTAIKDFRDLNAERAAGHIVPFDAQALRREATVHHGDHAFTGKVAVGADHVIDVDANLQVLGGGEVLFHARVPAHKTQEKDRDRTRLGVLSFSPYDKGVRAIVGAAWRNGVMQHNPDDPIVHILGMDSGGTVSKSTEDYSQATVERSQLWVVQEDHERKVIKFCPARAGWGYEVVAGTATTNHRAGELGHADKFQDRRAAVIAPLPGAV